MTTVNQPADPDVLRIGTQEREDAVRALGEHFAAGRLPVDEYEKRVTEALESQTRGELRPLFADLPAPYPAFMIPPPAPIMPMPVYPPTPYTPAYSDKNKIAAGILQILLPFGVGRFYTGHTGIAVAQLLTSLLFIGVIWSIIDGIILLISGGTDGEGRRLRDS